MLTDNPTVSLSNILFLLLLDSRLRGNDKK